MSFKLAAHLAQPADQPDHAPAVPEMQINRGARQLASTGLSAATADAIRFSALPGFGSAFPQASPTEESNAAAQQLKIQQDTYALMNGPGINVVVKNVDQQSRFG